MLYVNCAFSSFGSHFRLHQLVYSGTGSAEQYSHPWDTYVMYHVRGRQYSARLCAASAHSLCDCGYLNHSVKVTLE